MASTPRTQPVERWGRFELDLVGPAEGNPFVDVELSARFRHGNRTVPAEGFYDGEGHYKIRFMPDVEGEWTCETSSNREELSGIRESFECVPPSAGIHGPVRVSNRRHFSYEDGSPYKPVGTTCYVWNHQGDAREEQTLATLKTSPFNKMRMCVFPKSYAYNRKEPEHYPFEGNLQDGWDFTRFSPAFFHHLERRIADLMRLGIEADLILFHPYDRWGFSDMGAEVDDRYLHYIVARLASFRNVWWSFANEYDLMRSKKEADWDRFIQIVQECDPSQHLRSIHNCREFFDHNKPGITHQSIQHHDMYQMSNWLSKCRKPAIVDECGYEGNIQEGWGNLTAEQLVERFWIGFTRGGYVGHGETYYTPEEVLWWSHGAVLKGQSPPRIAFLRRLIEEGPATGIDDLGSPWDTSTAGVKGEYYLIYYGRRQPSFKNIDLPEDKEFTIEIIDTWEMTIQPLEGRFSGRFRLELPGKPYIALRIRKA